MTLKVSEVFHIAALLKETIEFLNIKPGEVYIDATLGGGGHAMRILEQGGKILGIDCDPEAVTFAKERLRKAYPEFKEGACPNASWQVAEDNFVNLTDIARAHSITTCAGVLFDLGTSFYQLETGNRGFSFDREGYLDMRMSPSLAVTAGDLINGLSKRELVELFTKLGEENLALPIAREIVAVRTKQPIKDTKLLANLIGQVYEKYRLRTKIHPATKVFQALRIAVNDELNNLRRALPQAKNLLKPGGRLVVISFQGLEDRIVKNFLKITEDNKEMIILTKKPVVPTLKEQLANRRCRSAKLRCSEKL